MFTSLKKYMGAAGSAAFPFDIKDKIGDSYGLVWSIHEGKRKSDGEAATILVFDVQTNRDKLAAARNGLRRLKTMRHPNIVKILEGVETDNHIYIALEPCHPLCSMYSEIKNDLEISWGLHQILKAVIFMSDAGMGHNAIGFPTVFVDKTGDWKIGCLDFVTGGGGEDNEAAVLAGIPPELRIYQPPEAARGSSSSSPWATDMWGFGCLVWEAFNGRLHNPNDLMNLDAVPRTVVKFYKEMVAGNPESRPKPQRVMQAMQKKGGYFNNEFINTSLFLEEIAIKDVEQKVKFYESLPSMISTFPKDCNKYKILPLLVNALEFGGGGAAVLQPMLEIAKNLNEEEFTSSIVPCIVKLFSSNDRAIRVHLLQNMGSYIDHISTSLMSEQIFPNIANGFNDTVAVLRENTVKSCLFFVTKLTPKVIEGQLLRYLAKLQGDPEPGIRTNTTICLGKIAGSLRENIRTKVFLSAFSRAMKDPFFHCRAAGVMAFSATSEYFTIDDIAKRVLPVLCASTVDPNKNVRIQCFNAIRLFVGKLEKNSEQMKEEAPPTPTSGSANAGANSGGGAESGNQNEGAGWGGWALGTISKYVSKSEQGSASDLKSTASSRNESENENAMGSAAASAIRCGSDRPPISATSGDKWGRGGSDGARMGAGDSGHAKAAVGDGWGDDDDGSDYDDDVKGTSSFGSGFGAKAKGSDMTQVKNTIPVSAKLSSAKKPLSLGARKEVKKTTSEWEQLESELVGGGGPPKKTKPKGAFMKTPSAASSGDGWGDDDLNMDSLQVTSSQPRSGATSRTVSSRKSSFGSGSAISDDYGFGSESVSMCRQSSSGRSGGFRKTASTDGWGNGDDDDDEGGTNITRKTPVARAGASTSSGVTKEQLAEKRKQEREERKQRMLEAKAKRQAAAAANKGKVGVRKTNND
eukprot:Nk52_evm13s2039 gene=Nk52_evmTU13s2039